MAVDSLLHQFGCHPVENGARFLGHATQDPSRNCVYSCVIHGIETVGKNDSRAIGDGNFARVLKRSIAPTIQISR